MRGLRLEGVSRQVAGRTLLDGIHLEVAPGECIALLGPSGCGKTTTLRVVAGLDPLSAGRLVLDGEDISKLEPALRRVGMVFQSYALYPHLSVQGNLELGLQIRGVPEQERHRRIAEVLELLQLEGLELRRPQQLSGGQRQRVALARALLRQPQLMLLDEPMSNLDAQLREQLRGDLRALLRSAGHPVIYVTHDQQEALGLADRIAVLREGRLQQIGTAQELYRNPSNRFVATFLGRPGINLLEPLGERQLGLRPEHIALVDAEGLPARLQRREWLGAQQLLWLESPRGPLRVLCPADASLPEALQLRWRSEDELWFDSSSGLRL
jgi:multiple sugar transport system ATP-binding protein